MLIFFLHLLMAAPAVILYIVLPSVSAGVVGYIWGAAVTFNQKDFLTAAKGFAHETVRPSEALGRLRARTKR